MCWNWALVSWLEVSERPGVAVVICLDNGDVVKLLVKWLLWTLVEPGGLQSSQFMLPLMEWKCRRHVDMDAV